MNAIRTLSRRMASAATATIMPQPAQSMRRLLFCHGIGSTNSDVMSKQIERWSSKHQIPFHNMKYSNYGKADVLWNINDWKTDILSEMTRLSSLKDSWNSGMEALYPDHEEKNEIILVCNSAAVQAVLRALLSSDESVRNSMMPGGILLISPGIGIAVQNYLDRVIRPVSIAELKSGATFYHPAVDPNLRILMNLENINNFANDCPTIKNDDPVPLHCPVRIVHGIWDKLSPYRNSVSLLDRLTSKNKALYLVNDGHFIKDQTIIEYALDSLWQAVTERQ